MRRWLRARLLLVLIALALIPAATLPFAERLRTEWRKFWEPEPKGPKFLALESDLYIYVNGVYVGSADQPIVQWVGMEPVPEEIPIIVLDPIGTGGGDGGSRP